MKKGKRAFLALLAALLTALPACAESGEPSIPSAPSSRVLEGESLVQPVETPSVSEATPAPEEESLPPVSSALESASPASEREESREDGALSLEDLQNQQGDFLLPGFYYGIDPHTLSLFVGLPEQEPVDCQEVPALMNMYPAYVLTTYEMGTVRLLGETFQVEATFEDDALVRCELVRTAQEGEDLSALYESLCQEQKALYGLSSSGEIRQEIQDERGRKVADRTLVFETFEEEGDLSTRLEGEGLILEETMTQATLSISLYDPIVFPSP